MNSPLRSEIKQTNCSLRQNLSRKAFHMTHIDRKVLKVMQYAAVVTGEYRWSSRFFNGTEDMDKRCKVLGKSLSTLRMVRE